MKNRISVVIAAYNEAPRIAGVLKVVENSPLIDEVIVVNDGSTDNTSGIVRKFKNVKLNENKKNIGKTLSVKKGVETSKNDLIMLLDADLVGLNQKSIKDLVEPVLSNKVDWTISLRGNSFKVMRFLKMDWLSGERVILKSLLLDPIIWSRPDVGYGLEVLMNKSLLDKKCTFRTIYLKNVINTRKTKKEGIIKGTYRDYWVIKEISKIMPLHKFIAQFLTMAYLNKKYSKL